MPDPPNVRGACRRRGGEVRRIGCAACRGRVEIKVLACTLHRECTVATELDGVKCCAGCANHSDDRPIFTPIDQGRLLPGHNFNCSIAAHQGRRLLAYRRSWSNARIRMAILGTDWQPTQCLREAWIDPPGYRGHEDPRLFTFRGRLHCSYTAYDGRKTDVGYQRFRDDLTAETGWVLDVPGRRAWEKNWAFFEWESQLFAVYTPTPHVVLRVDGGRVERAYETAWAPHYPYGEMRGGASPVQVGDEFFHFFHSRRDGDNGTYGVGVYAFEARPPFRPTRFCRTPLVMAEVRERPDPATATVVYPGGAVLDGETWRVACGYMDAGMRIYEFDAAMIDRKLRPL